MNFIEYYVQMYMMKIVAYLLLFTTMNVNSVYLYFPIIVYYACE